MRTSQTSASVPTQPHPLLEWLIWSAISTGVIVIYLTLGQRPTAAAPEQTGPLTSAPSALAFIGLAPLVASTALRWLLLPRMTTARKRLPLFIAGVALAEACGILGIFLGGAHKDTLFALSLLGLAQYFPAFLPRFASPDQPSFR